MGPNSAERLHLDPTGRQKEEEKRGDKCHKEQTENTAEEADGRANSSGVASTVGDKEACPREGNRK